MLKLTGITHYLPVSPFAIFPQLLWELPFYHWPPYLFGFPIENSEHISRGVFEHISVQNVVRVSEFLFLLGLFFIYTWPVLQLEVQFFHRKMKEMSQWQTRNRYRRGKKNHQWLRDKTIEMVNGVESEERKKLRALSKRVTWLENRKQQYSFPQDISQQVRLISLPLPRSLCPNCS